nr:MAG: E7 [Pan troglodytes papillomavirus 1]WCI99991.1 MAG: E7 [Pan troglodytes papillomavirus 1]
MRGPSPTLEDIVLHLAPTNEPDLLCYESLDSSDDDEEDTTDGNVTRQAQQQLYRVLSACSMCTNTVELVVDSTRSDLLILQELLMGALHIVCPLCAHSE